MNTRLGKSFGLAFVVAVGILALMFALGTFNAQKAGAQAADSTTIEPRFAASNMAIAFTISAEATEAITDAQSGQGIVVTLPVGFVVPAAAADITDVDVEVRVDGELMALSEDGDGNIDGLVYDPGNLSITLTLKDTDEDATTSVDTVLAAVDAEVSVLVRESAGIKTPPTVDDYAVTLTLGGADATTATLTVADLSLTPADPEPGEDVIVKVTFHPDSVFDDTVIGNDRSIENHEVIEIDLTDFGLPSSIAPTSVLIQGQNEADNDDGPNISGNPVDAWISGDSVFVEIANPDEDTDNVVDLSEDNPVTITLRQRAGISAPSAAGDYTVKVDMPDRTGNEAVELRPILTIVATLSVDPGDGGSGTEITVSGDAFSDGTASLSTQAWTDDEDGVAVAESKPEFLKSVTIDDGSFSTTIEAGDLESGHENGWNQLSIRDASGGTGTAMFQVTGTMEVSPSTINKGEVLKISLTNWIGAEVASVKISGIPIMVVDEDGKDKDAITYTLDVDDMSGDFYVKVTPENESDTIRLGEKTVALFDADDERLASETITIAAGSLSVTPSTAVSGQEVTVSGSGFSAGDDGTSVTITVDGDEATPKGSAVPTSSGQITVSIDIPAGITDGSKTIAVMDVTGRVGQVDITVPETTVTIEPSSSKRGSTLKVDGSGFPAGENVMLYYGDVSRGSEMTDSTGAFTAAVDVPSTANIGEDTMVKAVFDIYEAEIAHSVPAQSITLSSATAQSGEYISISGNGFPAYVSVKVEFGALDPITTGVNTDGNGDFPATRVLVPGQDPGSILVRVHAGDYTATELLDIVDAPAITTQASADAFADLIAADNLIVVWYFDNDTKDWSFYDPRPSVAAAVDLDMVSSGDNVWIQITADQEFQGEMLTAGWNLVTLD